MSIIDFSKLELDDETKAHLDAALENESISAFLTQSIENRENAIRESADSEIKKVKEKLNEFRETNISQQKQLEQLQAIDPEEYGRLKALGSDVKNAAEKIKAVELEGEAKLQASLRKIEEQSQQLEELNQLRETDSMRFSIQNGISEWNLKNPQLAVQNGAESVIIDKALKSYKKLDGKVVMLDGESDYMTENGFGTINEWIGGVAKKSMPFCFKQITGGGASGSDGNGVTRKFSEMSGGEKVKLYNENLAEYNRLKEKG